MEDVATKRRDSSLVRAAEYVRMSTDHQKYSTANQSEAIRTYAAMRGMMIVSTYSDEGRSGLSLKKRPGLGQLIADVQSSCANFSAILVYDVSRWGRFQTRMKAVTTNTSASVPALWSTIVRSNSRTTEAHFRR